VPTQQELEAIQTIFTLVQYARSAEAWADTPAGVMIQLPSLDLSEEELGRIQAEINLQLQQGFGRLLPGVPEVQHILVETGPRLVAFVGNVTVSDNERRIIISTVVTVFINALRRVGLGAKLTGLP
jgi:hypothetical protein